MVRYIALLRGINVGGHNVKMERLREIFTELGLHNVRSYLNSGNIFFDVDDTNRQSLTTTIEKHLIKALGYEVPTFLRTTTELEAILAENPFREVELTNDRRFCVVFTKEPLLLEITFPLHSNKNDMDLIACNLHEAFVVWRIINGRPPSGRFAKDVIPTVNTTRFYHTLAKILASALA